MQWQQSGERDVVRYIVNWRREDYQQGGAPDVEGRESTYTQLTGLTPGKLYYMRIQAQDFSGNLSSESSQVFCIAAAPEDSTNPTITLEQPTMGTAYTTSAPAVTFSGIAAGYGRQPPEPRQGHEQFERRHGVGLHPFRGLGCVPCRRHHAGGRDEQHPGRGL